MHTARRKKRSFTGETQPETSTHFSVMFFSQDKASKPPLYMHTARRKKRSFTGNSARTSNHFSAMFFRKTRKINDGVLSVLRAKFDAVFGKLSPNLKSFFGDVFSQDKASKPPLYMHTARRKKRSFTGETQPETSNHFSVMFFRKTRKISADVQAYFKRNLTQYSGNSAPNLSPFFGDVFSQDKENERRRTSVLQAKFDAVLRKNSPKNQISIMSASFFFAISSISLTYLSVIF